MVFDEKANLLPKSAAERVVRVARAAGRPGLQVELGGQAIESTEQAGFGLSTAVGLLAAIVVLLLTFGSLTAMGMPIVTALFGLGTGLGVIALFTHVVDTPNFSSELAAMIGLGVGIDYSLFILTRFREAYATPGPTFGDARESVVQAMDTAGRAVLFAGCTVVIALLGMMLLGVDFLYGVAISASIGVLLVMLASLTLLPALLTLAGARVTRPSRRARRRARSAADGRGGRRRGRTARPQPGHRRRHHGAGAHAGPAAAGSAWLRWSGFVQRRPWPIAIAATLMMLADRGPGDGAAARLERRLERPREPDDPPRVRAARAGLRRRLQRAAAGRGEGPQPEPQAAAGRVTRRRRAAAGSVERLRAAIAATPGVASVAPAEDQPGRRSGDDHRLSALLPAGLRDHPARLAPARRRHSAARRSAPA